MVTRQHRPKLENQKMGLVGKQYHLVSITKDLYGLKTIEEAHNYVYLKFGFRH